MMSIEPQSRPSFGDWKEYTEDNQFTLSHYHCPALPENVAQELDLKRGRLQDRIKHLTPHDAIVLQMNRFFLEFYVKVMENPHAKKIYVVALDNLCKRIFSEIPLNDPELQDHPDLLKTAKVFFSLYQPRKGWTSREQIRIAMLNSLKNTQQA